MTQINPEHHTRQKHQNDVFDMYSVQTCLKVRRSDVECQRSVSISGSLLVRLFCGFPASHRPTR